MQSRWRSQTPLFLCSWEIVQRLLRIPKDSPSAQLLRLPEPLKDADDRGGASKSFTRKGSGQLLPSPPPAPKQNPSFHKDTLLQKPVGAPPLPAKKNGEKKNQKPKIKNQKSKIKNQKSKIEKSKTKKSKPKTGWVIPLRKKRN